MTSAHRSRSHGNPGIAVRELRRNLRWRPWLRSLLSPQSSSLAELTMALIMIMQLKRLSQDTVIIEAAILRYRHEKFDLA